eukprot:4604504-Prymnesium_polylepis.1
MMRSARATCAVRGAGGATATRARGDWRARSAARRAASEGGSRSVVFMWVPQVGSCARMAQ